MHQRLTFITIAVKNLDKMKEFYQDKFKWTTLKDSDGIVFYQLNGIILGLFPEKELSDDIGIPGNGKCTEYKNVAMAINFNSEIEVDAVFDELRNSNVKIIREPEKVFWGGYRGYIADVENNYWELAFNPFLEMDESGNVKTHS